MFDSQCMSFVLLSGFTESFQFTHSGRELNVSRAVVEAAASEAAQSASAASEARTAEKRTASMVFANVNHPLSMPDNLKYRTTITAPSGFNLQLIVPTRSAQQNCTDDNFVQVKVQKNRAYERGRFLFCSFNGN